MNSVLVVVVEHIWNGTCCSLLRLEISATTTEWPPYVFTVLSNSDVQHLSSLCCLPLFYIKAWELQDLNLSIYEAATMHAQLFLMFNYYLRSHTPVRWLVFELISPAGAGLMWEKNTVDWLISPGWNQQANRVIDITLKIMEHYLFLFSMVFLPRGDWLVMYMFIAQSTVLVFRSHAT